MRTVEFSLTARRDLSRLRQWLDERALHVTREAIEVIVAAYKSLAEFPERGRTVPEGLRELIVPFGSAGYVLQYDVRPGQVTILRIFHSLEDR
ncbi:MAG: type II toxin-antitoxin system RelE/ParE family toxin [Caulobacter sp.]|nr:type II toxin-antitoxin system RelE/ParE family toxin [Caulobacter sp.]